MRKITFINGEIYHVFNRGVEKRKILLEQKDYFRFIHDLYEFNDTHSALASNARFSLNYPSKVRVDQIAQTLEARPPNFARGGTKRIKPRKLLIDLLAFCIMPNHFHLLVRQRVNKGISLFMQKVGTGYSMYFNEKNKRVGPLFQGRFKAVHIFEEKHFIYIPHYIHLNPLDLTDISWRLGKVRNSRKCMKYLLSYRWSSFNDYIGKRNFPSVTQRELLADYFETPINYRNNIWELLHDMDMEELDEYTLD